MPNLHVIIGDPDTRKSSLTRCLVGVGRVNHGSGTRWDVALVRGAPIKLFCKVASLQEGQHAMGSTAFIRFVKDLRPVPDEILISLRVSGGRFPDAVDYLSAFNAASWPVRSVALMDTSAIGLAPLRALAAGARVARVPGSSIVPTNASAALVRKVWGWV